MRYLIAVLMALLAVAAFATGGAEVETEGTVHIGIWGDDIPLTPSNPDSLLLWRDYLFGGQDVEFTWYHPGDGAAQPIDLDVAAGVEPDVYFDYAGRVGKYATPKYAAELEGILPAGTTDDYIPSFLDLFRKDDGLYALPETAWAQCMVVNTTLLERVGMLDVIADQEWTMDEFMEASRRVSELGPDHYGFVLFAASTAGDYWHLGFLPGLGAKLFEGGRIALGSPEGLRAMQWYADYPYAMPGAAALDYSAMMQAFKNGKALAFGGSWGNIKTGIEAHEAGLVDEPFGVALTAYPHVDGVDQVGLALGPDAAMIFRGHESPAAIQALITLTGERSQRARVSIQKRFASLQSVGIDLSDENHVLLSDLIARNGVMDLGMGLTEYTQVRALIPPMFQAIYSGEMTVSEAVARFVSEGNAILQ